MRVAERGSQREVLALAGLDRKAKDTAVSQRAADLLKRPRQVTEVDEDIGGERKIELRGLSLQKIDQFAADQIVVDLALSGDLEHVRGDIDPGQGPGQRVESRSQKTGTATKVQNVQVA